MNSEVARSAEGFWRRLLSLTRKEIRQLLRDRSNLLIGVGLPIFLILIFGYGLSLDVDEASIGVVMEDSSPTARDLVSTLQYSPYTKASLVHSWHEAKEMMDAHQLDAIVAIPGDFSARLAAQDAQLQIVLQGSDPSRATAIKAYIEAAIGIWQQKQGDRGGSMLTQTSGVMVVERMWFNAANNSTWYLVPGLIVLIMTLTGTFLTALVMAREWERGTLEALFVTPVRPVEILLAKVIPYFLVGLLGFFLCLAAARFLFFVPLYGSLLVLIAVSMLYMLVSLGIGLLISAFTKNQFLASQFAILMSFMPAMMLSDFVFDLRNVPTVIRWIGQMLPATYFMELVKTLFLTGNYWPLIIKNSVILLGYALVLLGLACWVTRKRVG